MGNTEGTPQPGDSVETTREASTEKEAPADGMTCPHCKVLAVSSAEALLNRAFRKLSISFSTQQILLGSGYGSDKGYVADLLIIQQPVIVEADERYHQVQRERRERDRIRDAAFHGAGYAVFRFTDEEIGDDANACALYVAERAGLVPEDEPVFKIRQPMSGPDSATWTGGKPGWNCLTCGKHFHAYKRPGGKPCTTCSRECQRIWQMESGASTQNRRSNGEAMRKLWADPEWRAQQIKLSMDARWRRA
jgi:very-short-patch-repair endonuclease